MIASSVVPGLPNMVSMPSEASSDRNAARPDNVVRGARSAGRRGSFMVACLRGIGKRSLVALRISCGQEVRSALVGARLRFAGGEEGEVAVVALRACAGCVGVGEHGHGVDASRLL